METNEDGAWRDAQRISEAGSECAAMETMDRQQLGAATLGHIPPSPPPPPPRHRLWKLTALSGEQNEFEFAKFISFK